MSEEVKTDFESEWRSSLSPSYQPPFDIWLQFRLQSARHELQSERQARLSAETKLRELQDAVKSFIRFTYTEKEREIILEAIQESQTRNSES